MTSHGGSLAGNTLHSTTITEVHVGVVVEEVIAGLVEGGSSLSLGNGQTDGVGETLAERTGGDLNTGGVVSLGVTGGDAVELLFFLVRMRFTRTSEEFNIHGSSSGHPC